MTRGDVIFFKKGPNRKTQESHVKAGSVIWAKFVAWRSKKTISDLKKLDLCLKAFCKEIWSQTFTITRNPIDIDQTKPC